MPEAGVDRAALAETFRGFGAAFHHESPLYAALSTAVAASPELLELAALGDPRQPLVQLFLGVVHERLMEGVDHPLGRYFPTIDRSAGPADAETLLPVLVDFCRAERPVLAERLRIRRVQTNEVGRTALFLPALLAISTRTLDPLATVEIGASAGLNLLWPWVRVDYGAHGVIRPVLPGPRLHCEVRGGRPPRSPEPPRPGLRLGLDSHPVDLSDPNSVRWLAALVWPEHEDRRNTLLAAIRLAQARGVTVERGDLRTDLVPMLERVPPGQQIVVLHSWVLNQLTEAERAALDADLTAFGRRRRVYRVGVESLGTPTCELSLTRYEAGACHHATLARVHPHGRWLEWLDTALP